MRGASVALMSRATGPSGAPSRSVADTHCPPGSVRFLGYLESVDAFMAACDVLAFPTQPELGEGFGLAALEAMAAGRPVLATDVGSLPEVVVDGVDGTWSSSRIPVIGARTMRSEQLAYDAAAQKSNGRCRIRACSRGVPTRRDGRQDLAVYEELI